MLLRQVVQVHVFAAMRFQRCPRPRFGVGRGRAHPKQQAAAVKLLLQTPDMALFQLPGDEDAGQAPDDRVDTGSQQPRRRIAAGPGAPYLALQERDMSEGFDFISACRPEMTLRTRGRSEVRITKVDPAEGLVYGDVAMYGACVWHRDGRFRDAPAGAAGPLDLLPPETAASAPRKTISLTEALDPAGRPFCCD